MFVEIEKVERVRKSQLFFFPFFQTEEDFKLMKFEEECQQNYLMKTNSPSSHDTKLDEVKERLFLLIGFLVLISHTW